ncbi:MAG: hypothetical protein ACI8U1_001537, partial [Rheinheimera aquimaris]
MVASVHLVRINRMKKVQFRITPFLCCSVFAVILTGCATPPPKNTSNLCEIFYEHRDWYDAAAKVRDKWGVPIHVPMSIMYQESSFKHNARPPMRWFLGFIPYGRASNAYGYSQAKTVT